MFFQIFPDIDECSELVACGDHAVCENVDGGYNCSCKEGYQTSTGKAQFTPNDGTYCQGKLSNNYVKYVLHSCKVSKSYIFQEIFLYSLLAYKVKFKIYTHIIFFIEDVDHMFDIVKYIIFLRVTKLFHFP